MTLSFTHARPSRPWLLGGLILLAACGQTPTPQALQPDDAIQTQALTAAPTLQPGQTYSFRVPGTSNRYLARDAFEIIPYATTAVTKTGSSDLYSAEAAATWNVVAGAADPSCVSLGILQYANTYLQGRGFTSPEDNYTKPYSYGLVYGSPRQNATFDKELTFCVRPGLSGQNGTLSFESKAYPGYFVTHKADNTVTFEKVSTASVRQDATWIAEAGLANR